MQPHLVDEHDRIPTRRDVQDTIQGFVERACGGAKVSAANNVQRPSYVLAGRLRRQRLADARGPKQVDNETVALPLHEIVEARVVVRFYERSQEVLAIIGEYEVLKRFVVPHNRLDMLDVELDCTSYGYL